MQNVMIVEDDVMYRYAIRSSVEWEREGFQICGEAINGKHALALLNECRPQVVITDIHMPEMNGIDLIVALQKLDPNIYIIVLSSYDDFQFVRQALKYGAKDYFLKHDLEPETITEILHDYKLTLNHHKTEEANHVDFQNIIQLIDTDQEEVSQVIEYIKSHYHEAISLQQLADHVYLSPNYLCNVFKKETGVTIFDYIKLFRIEIAKHLLEATSLRVYEIAEQVGFNNSSYFCRVFKEISGQSVNEYRRTI